jgi:dihydrofolate reductase
MRKIILDLAVSLDGFIEGANGEIDWCIFDDEVAAELNTFIQGVDAVFYGRVSYELFGNYQPGAERPEGERDFYNKVNALTKYVFSTTLEKVDSSAILVKESIAEKVQEIKQQAGKDIWLFGGGGLITTFVNLSLIDEYRIGVHPVVLGAGIPLFKHIQQRVNLKLIRTKQFKSGLAGLYYQPVRNQI